jgi:putative hemolysin
VLAALVGGLAGGLALALLRFLPARSSARAPAGGVGDPDTLIERLAQLDVRYADRASEMDPAEWERYRAERAELAARLRARLGGRPGGSG